MHSRLRILTIGCLVGASISAQTAVIGLTQGKGGGDQVSQQNIRTSKGPLETLIPWVTRKNFYKELLTLCT